MKTEPDVLTLTRGGLGNQLFEYASTLHALGETDDSSYELIFTEGRFSPDLIDFLTIDARQPGRRDRVRVPELADLPGPLRPLLRQSARLHERRSGRFVVS